MAFDLEAVPVAVEDAVADVALVVAAELDVPPDLQ